MNLNAQDPTGIVPNMHSDPENFRLGPIALDYIKAFCDKYFSTALELSRLSLYDP